MKVGVFWGVPKAGLKQLMVRVRRVLAIEERAGKSCRARDSVCTFCASHPILVQKWELFSVRIGRV